VILSFGSKGVCHGSSRNHAGPSIGMVYEPPEKPNENIPRDAIALSDCRCFMAQQLLASVTPCEGQARHIPRTNATRRFSKRQWTSSIVRSAERVRAFRYSRLSPIDAANAANDPDKPLILLRGGPGRTRTSNQVVMSEQRRVRKKRLLAAEKFDRTPDTESAVRTPCEQGKPYTASVRRDRYHAAPNRRHRVASNRYLDIEALKNSR
jgi:hypothetical protein